MPTVTKTIGTAGRDYSTITAWEAALDDTAAYSASDDAVGECYDDSVFNEAVIINGGTTVGLSSITLSVASGERHTGVAGTGARIVYTGGSVTDIIQTYNLDLPVTVEWLEITTGAHTSTIAMAFLAIRVRKQQARYLLVHDLTTANQNTAGIGLEVNTGVGDKSVIHNNIVYNLDAVNRNAFGIRWSTASSRSFDIYNNTVYNIIGDGDGNETVACIYTASTSSNRNIKNNVCCNVTGAGTANCFILGATVSNNASSDTSATGTGSLTSLDASSQFVSIVGGSEDLHLKAGSDCIGAGADLGTTPTGINIDIDGDPRGATWDIGADEYVSLAAVGRLVNGGLVNAGLTNRSLLR